MGSSDLQKTAWSAPPDNNSLLQISASRRSPVVEEDSGEEAGQDAEVADGEDVDIDHVAQAVDHCTVGTGVSE